MNIYFYLKMATFSEKNKISDEKSIKDNDSKLRLYMTLKGICCLVKRDFE